MRLLLSIALIITGAIFISTIFFIPSIFSLTSTEEDAIFYLTLVSLHIAIGVSTLVYGIEHLSPPQETLCNKKPSQFL
jgi:hypothetical protein